jgi:FixJ family two-component response regulator
MPYKNATVYVVDDDESVRNAMTRLLKTVGLRVEVFGSARAFLDHDRADVPGCLLLDVRMPGLNGLDLQQELAAAEVDLPIVFMTAHGDIPMSVRAIKAGAVDFLPKPVNDQELLNTVGQAIDQHIRRRRNNSQASDIRARIESLTPREREVLSLVCEGLMNKQIAGRLNIAQPTVKFHRRHLMEKMGASSIAELVQLVEKSGVSTPKV